MLLQQLRDIRVEEGQIFKTGISLILLEAEVGEDKRRVRG